MNQFGIITNVSKDKDYQLTKKMKRYIESKGGVCHMICEDFEIDSKTECIFVLGGDGTLIRASGQASDKNIPLIGVNLGHMGYLCELEENNVFEAVDEILRGNYSTEERMMLSGNTVLSGEKKAEFTALNDIVISRKGALQLIELIVYVNGEYLHTFRADGIIIATPTGSTGYSMSAGGPIVAPTAHMILITPINSQNLNAKSIVVDAENEITIKLGSRQSEKNEKAEVNFDGERAEELSVGDFVTVRTSEKKTKILKLSKVSFLEILRKKMQAYS